MAEDTCTKCGFTGGVALFVKGRHVCKACKAAYDKEQEKTYVRKRR